MVSATCIARTGRASPWLPSVGWKPNHPTVCHKPSPANTDGVSLCAGGLETGSSGLQLSCNVRGGLDGLDLKRGKGAVRARDAVPTYWGCWAFCSAWGDWVPQDGVQRHLPRRRLRTGVSLPSLALRHLPYLGSRAQTHSARQAPAGSLRKPEQGSLSPSKTRDICSEGPCDFISWGRGEMQYTVMQNHGKLWRGKNEQWGWDLPGPLEACGWDSSAPPRDRKGTRTRGALWVQQPEVKAPSTHWDHCTHGD